MADRFATMSRPIYGQGQNVAYTGTAGTIANALPNGTGAVVVMCTTAAFVRVGTSPTATTADLPVAANVPVRLEAAAGDKVSAIQVASGGTLYVSPCAE